MASRKKIAADLEAALHSRKPLDIDVYVDVLASHEARLQESLDEDADDAMLCMIADDGNVAMLVIGWDGHIYRNENALEQLRQMWGISFDQNVKIMVLIFAEHISQGHLGVAGIKWVPQDPVGQ